MQQKQLRENPLPKPQVDGSSSARRMLNQVHVPPHGTSSASETHTLDHQNPHQVDGVTATVMAAVAAQWTTERPSKPSSTPCWRRKGRELPQGHNRPRG